jgi:hypothetical protein
MSKRGEREYLADIREAIQRIQSYTTGLSYGQFLDLNGGRFADVHATLLRDRDPAAPTLCAHGRLRIRRGNSRLARFVAAVCRLPRTSEAAAGQADCQARRQRRDWDRSFDGHHLKTRQHRSADGDLIERFRPPRVFDFV